MSEIKTKATHGEQKGGSKKCGNCRFFIVTNHVIGGTENCSNIPQPASGTEVKLKPVYYYEVCAKWEGAKQQ